jgi:hypothetical protein
MNLRRPRVPGLSVLLAALLSASSWLIAGTSAGEAEAEGGGGGAQTSRPPAARPFSQDEERRLRAGELVARPSSEERDGLRLIGGTSWQLVDAPPEQVFRALCDTSRYARMLPAVTGSSLLHEQPGYHRVRLEHKKGPIGISYEVGARFYQERLDVTFALESAPYGLPKAAWGFFSVRPYGTRQTLLAYGVMTDPGDGLVLSFVRSSVHEWLLRVPRQVKFYVESREARARYAAPAAPPR